MDRDDLHDLIMLLREEVQAGRIKINSADTIRALSRVISRLADPSRMLFDTEWSGTPLQQLERYERETAKNLVAEVDLSRDPRQVLEMMIFGRMMQTNDAVFRGERYGGTPLIDAPTSWQYLLWKYDESGKTSPESSQMQRDFVIANTMALEGKEHGMLSGIPPEALIELRRNGASNELRAMLCKGIGEIDSASEATLSSVGKQVIENVDNAFSEHEQQLKALSSSRYKFYGVDVSRYLTVGGFSIAAARWPSVSLGILTAVAAMSGPPSPGELSKRFRELSSQSDKLRRSPAGIMFRHIKRNFGFS
jgi:hypothetical protein